MQTKIVNSVDSERLVLKAIIGWICRNINNRLEVNSGS